MKENYYGVAGVNGYGVYDAYETAVVSKRYMPCWKIKKQKSFELAKEWAEQTYQDLQLNHWQGYKIEEIEKVNWVYYRKKVL